MKPFLPLVFISILAACRKDPIEVRRVPKEDVPPMTAMGVGETPRPKSLLWSTPTGWKETAGAGMREATLTPPQEPGKSEVTVVALPGDVGGDLANVNRWRGQIALPPVTEREMAEERVTVRTRLGTMMVYDFTGTGERPTRLVAGMIRVSGTTWFFKLMGDEKAVAAAKPAFVKLLESLRRDEA